MNKTEMLQQAGRWRQIWEAMVRDQGAWSDPDLPDEEREHEVLMGSSEEAEELLIQGQKRIVRGDYAWMNEAPFSDYEVK